MSNTYALRNQLQQQWFITDGGLETTLVFHHNIDLPYFASFTLLKSSDGRNLLTTYYRKYLALAKAHNAGFILEAPTWRSNPDWGTRMGMSPDAVDATNRDGIALMHELKNEAIIPTHSCWISGCIGPRGDGYQVGAAMTATQAKSYHQRQIEVFKETKVDLVSAITMTYGAEAQGIVLAAKEQGLPVVISFTLETDARLPSGETLHDAIAQVEAASDGYPLYYMINCAHPTHFEGILQDSLLRERVWAIRANASKCSHAELDEASELDDGNPTEMGQDYQRLAQALPNLRVLGGCCGTDHRHVSSMCDALIA